MDIRWGKEWSRCSLGCKTSLWFTDVCWGKDWFRCSLGCKTSLWFTDICWALMEFTQYRSSLNEAFWHQQKWLYIWSFWQEEEWLKEFAWVLAGVKEFTWAFARVKHSSVKRTSYSKALHTFAGVKHSSMKRKYLQGNKEVCWGTKWYILKYHMMLRFVVKELGRQQCNESSWWQSILSCHIELEQWPGSLRYRTWGESQRTWRRYYFRWTATLFVTMHYKRYDWWWKEPLTMNASMGTTKGMDQAIATTYETPYNSLSYSKQLE